jgi:branched-chain amino acid transport system substrate-binding protein
VVSLRALRGDTRLFGGSSMARRSFLDQAGRSAEGVLFPLLCDPGFRSSPFARRFRARFGKEADCTTVQAYDAVRLVIDAIGRAGLNRARIRDAVRELSPWSGSAGIVEWNPVGQNQREAHPATYKDGRVAVLR